MVKNYFNLITGTCEISPNTTGEFGISNAIGFFTATPTAGTCIFDTSASAGIISVTNTKWIQFLKSGKYWIAFNAFSNNSNN